MAIEGDLSDISLPTMAQMICIERRNFALRVHRGSEEGEVHFERGEIVHAALGPLQGEEAMYQLLTWSNGTFRVSSEKAPPTKTINVSWNHLLLEGLRKLDEDRRDQAGESDPEEAVEQALEVSLESDLVSLLRNLDRELAELADCSVRRQSDGGLGTLERIVNTVVSFVESEIGAGLSETSLLQALAAAGDQVPEARLLKVHHNRLSTLTISNLCKSWGNDPADRYRTAGQVCRACTLLLERYSALLATHFQGRPHAERWRDMNRIVLGELNLMVARIEL